MKKTILYLFLVGILVGCDGETTEKTLIQASSKIKPSELQLSRGFNSYVQRTHVENIETGIITLADGSSSQFWFRSHHCSDDMGGTWFQFSDGRKKYMAGWFCCEVQLPKEQLASLEELNNFIDKYHGISP